MSKTPLAVALCLSFLAGCSTDSSNSSPTAERATRGAALGELPPPSAVKATDYPGLHNLVLFGDGIVSGSQPEGPEGFASLEALGFRSIVSVDGAEPDLASARAVGLRYVHLPIGYNGATPERIAEIARAVRDLPGPVYVHCHHGKHRSAAAAASAAILLGRSDKDQALAAMGVAGTAKGYTRLWGSVDEALAQPKDAVDRASNAFPEVTRPKGLAKSMIAVDEAFDHLKLIQAAAWSTPTDHPDLVPAAEAGSIADLFRLSADDTKSLRAHEAGLADALRVASANAQKLEDALARKAPAAELEPLFAQVKNDCTTCHKAHRDVELPH